MRWAAATILLLALAAPERAAAALLFHRGESRIVAIHSDPLVDGRRAHDVRVDRVGPDYRFRDEGSELIWLQDEPCREGADRHEVLCPADSVVQVDVLLGAGPDRLDAPVPLTVFACGGAGNDILRSGSGNDVLGGGAGVDELYGGDGADVLAVDLRALDADVCAPGPPVAADLLDGGGGPDALEGGAGDDVMAGGPGNDRLFGYDGGDRLDGGGDSDSLIGLAGDDALLGGDGFDLLYGGPGNDGLDGGPGDDALGPPLRHDADGLLGPGSAAAVVTEEGDDRFDGGDGDDSMYAGPGHFVDDQLQPLETQGRPFIDRTLLSAALNGADVYRGGAGRDSVSYVNRDRPVHVTLDGLPGDGSPGEGDQVEPDVETVAGGAQPDVMVAAPSGTFLFGDLSADTLVGGPGPDILSGGGDEGADVLRGLDGDDQLLGGPGGDRLDGARGRDLLVGGAGDDRAAGGFDSDSLEGGTGSDRLEGGPGVDCLHGFVFAELTPGPACPGVGTLTAAVGADGADSLHGGGGRDLLAGGPGEDVADYSDRRRRVVVALAGVPAARARRYGARAPDALAADVEGARGGFGHDTLLGDARDNPLDGGPGDDQIVGGGGVDRLRGGSGRDVVVARDGSADAVRCGTRRDLALIDGADEVVSGVADTCELLDGAGAGIGPRAVRVRPVGRCALGLRLPRVRRAFVLEHATTLPFGSRVDARSCRARVGGEVRRGRFTIRRRRS